MNFLNVSPDTGRSFSYKIIWNRSFDGLADAVRDAGLNPARICIVTDRIVGALYLESLRAAAEPLQAAVSVCILKGGEENKNLDSIREIYQVLMEAHLDRSDLILALGGGVTGDMAGFAAATYLRGIAFAQIPTTLLAQVDSSVGGKTGVDLDQYKNMIGAFYQPSLVYMNMSVLKTLPEEQFASGMAEVIKSAFIADESLIGWLENNREKVLEKDPEALSYMIRACCRIKADVVRQDPTETGLRAILNFGHTIGHAVEKLSGFRLGHGQCVAIGMNAAAFLSEQHMPGLNVRTRLCSLLEKYGLPSDVSGLQADKIVRATKSDKKMQRGRIRFILLSALGEAFIDRSVTDEELETAASVVLHHPDHHPRDQYPKGEEK